MGDSPVKEYRNKMIDWGLPLSQYSQQCQACFAPQSGSGLDIVENTEQGRQANQYRYPRPERRYSVFRNQGTVAPEYSAEVGDIRRFDDPKQLQKLAGYAIVANESGKYKGESRISYRGRKRLRYVLFEAALSLVARNPEFRKIYEYYRTRENNPLKKMQSLVAVACKVIRVFYVMLTKGVDYDPEKMMRDIRRPDLQAA